MKLGNNERELVYILLFVNQIDFLYYVAPTSDDENISEKN
jgi:hypothetical protein